jgi:hypothetical protein
LAQIATIDDLSDEQKASFEKWRKRFDASERLHREMEDRWNTWYGLSRNWHRLGSAYKNAGPNDKDVVINEIKREFGQELFIPYAFTVIETNVPRILSRTPRYRALPVKLGELEEMARRPMEKLYERDAANMRYERKLQETVRSGLRYGLGVQKEVWEKKYRDGKKVVPRLLGMGRKVEDTTICVYEGPQVESVDIFDFFWSPAAKDLQSSSYAIHRVWLSMEQVEERVKEGRKLRDEGKDHGWVDLDLEKIKGLATSTGRGAAWDGRHQAAGLSSYQSHGSEEFEVWECHDRDQVVTILGRQLPVAEAPNPYLHGDYPFEIYRPTIVEHEFCGIGEVEPIAHLQWELNEMRGQRRDAATLALSRGYFYQAGALDPTQIRTGVGVFNPVFQPPNDVIMPMPFTDIPQSGYEEENSIKGDIELASAISEAVVGSGGEDTATGTQLVQQAAGFRIKQKAKNLHVDLLRPETKKRKALYEQHVVAADQTQHVRVEDPTTPTGFAYLEVTPEMFAAEIEMEPIDGSTEPDDPAQKKHDAGELATALAPFAELVNVEELIKYITSQHDIENPGDWIKPPAPEGPDPGQIVEAIGQAMHDAGIDEEEIAEVLERAQKALATAQPEGGEQGAEQPEPEQVGAAQPQPA